MPELFHVSCRSTVIFRKIRKCHLIILISAKKFKTQCQKEIVFLHPFLTKAFAAHLKHFFFISHFKPMILQHFPGQFSFFFLAFLFLMFFLIFLADLHVPVLIEHAHGLIWNGIYVMTSVLCFPDNPCLFVIKIYNNTF